MIAFFLAPIYILVNIYVMRWALKWMGACHKHFKNRYFRFGFIAVYSILALSLLFGFLIKTGPLHRFFKVLGNYWLGTFLYILLTIILVDLGRIIILHIPKLKDKDLIHCNKTFVAVGSVTAVMIAAVSVFGIIHAKHIYTTSYQVQVDKSVEGIDSLKVVLIADMHLGYSTGDMQMRQMVRKINQQKPDLVCVAGDIFDNEFDAIKDPDKVSSTLKGIESTYGTYACYGNHDLNEPILAGFTFGSNDGKEVDPRMEEFLKKSNIQLLSDENILIDDKFYLIGRKDPSRTKKLESQRLTPQELTRGLDQTKPIIFIDHQPKELMEIADAGGDLDLCGHTHDGQLFPGNLTIGLMWENACGYLRKGDMHNIVTSGIGVWGPAMRVGTKSEIVSIQVNFTPN